MADTRTTPTAPERKLATIVAADVAGYSRIMGENEEAAITVLKGHREIYESLLGIHRGRLFNTAGDAFLSEFVSAVDAVRFATELQSAIRTRNDQLPEDQRMLFRIGINIGDVVVQGGDLLGDGVNVAARVQTSAEPGGICISGAVFDQIQNKLMLSIQSLGERDYKNLAQPVRTYSIAQADAGHFPTPSRRQAAGKGGSNWRNWMVVAAVTLMIVGGGAWWFYDAGEARRLEQTRLEQKLQAERATAEEARRKAETERMAAERQATDDARRRAEEDRLRAEAERRRIDEDRRRADEERQRADAERERFDRERRAAEEARARAEQERRRAETERFEAERRAAEEARQRAEEEARRAEAQRQEAERRAAEERQRAEAQRKAADEQVRRASPAPALPPPAPAAAVTPQSAAVAPAPGGAAAARFNGRYVGQFCSAPFGAHPENCWAATVLVTNGTLSGQFNMRSGAVHSWTGSVTAAGAVELIYDGISTQVTPGSAARAKLKGAINNVVMEMSGSWYGSNRPVSGRFVRQN